MMEVLVRVPPERLQEAVLREGQALILHDEDEILQMPGGRVKDLVSGLLAAMLPDEIRWLDEQGIPYSLKVTSDERAFSFTFETECDAARFQNLWGGEFVEETTSVLLH
jgi:hypothetical protein